MNDTRPSKKQRELLTFIERFIAEHGYGPSYREVMRGIGYKSVSTVAIHVNNLITKGHLRKRTRSARSLEVVRVVGGASEALPAAPQTPSKTDERWLVDTINHRFRAAETGRTLEQKVLDELYVLVGTLHILGFVDAARAAKSRLLSLQKTAEIE